MNGNRQPRTFIARVGLGLAALVAFAGFSTLGTWQVQRRAWKLDLVDRVEQRVHKAPAPVPGRGEWPQISAARDEYRSVRVAGVFLHDRETLVRAVTELGAGYWVMTPLNLADGSTVLVNRGFVPPEQRERASRPEGAASGEVTVIGLLRLTEPGGTLLRHNDPATERWYSRDVQAIAAARGLRAVAPYFIDAGAAQGATAPGGPIGGLTVIAFHNNHLVYAITWYTLALMVVIAMVILLRAQSRQPRAANGEHR
jgi:surfeit locus 1 family protein